MGNAPSTTYYVGGGYEIKDGVPTRYISGGNVQIAMVKNGVTSYFQKDHLGSSTVTTDGTGGVVEETQYVPFGGTRSHSGSTLSNYKFTGQELDPETGLYNYNARLYDPWVGMFITPDSMVPDFTNPQCLNRYAYCVNNPLAYVDPSGHNPFVIGFIIGAIIAGIQSDWDTGQMLVGGVIGAISGGVFSEAGAFMSGVTSGWDPVVAGIVNNSVAGMAAGATAGGLNAVYYGTDIGSGLLYGGLYGGVGGAAFGGISGYYGNNWNLYRVGAHTLAGGGVSALSGQGFEKGAIFAGAFAFARFTYNEITSFDVRWERGVGYQAKGRYTLPNDPTLCHIGEQGTALNGNFWHDFLLEGGRLSRTSNYIPGVNPTGVLHDVMQVKLDQFLGNILGENAASFTRSLLNVPNMIPAAVTTTAGLLADPRSMMLFAVNNER